MAAHNIAGEEKEVDLSAFPSGIYTNTEIAWVGLNETQVREKFGDVKVGTFPYTGLRRVMTIGQNDGFVKIIAEGKYGRVVGMEIIGAGVREIIHEGVLAIKEEFYSRGIGRCNSRSSYPSRVHKRGSKKMLWECL